LTSAPATPATERLTAAGISWRGHVYRHDRTAIAQGLSYGLEAAAALAETEAIDVDQVFKTLLVQVEGVGLVVAIVPVALLLDLKALGQVAGGKRAEMAAPALAERSTGYVVGGISPIGQRKALPTFLDERAIVLERIFVSGGRRGFDIEITPTDLLAVTGGQYAQIAR